MQNALNDYILTTNFNLDHLYNYHPIDLYYFEQALILYKTQQHLAADYAYDSIIPSSCRKIITTTLQYSRCHNDRTQGKDVEFYKGRNINLLRHIIKLYAPEIAAFPFHIGH